MTLSSRSAAAVLGLILACLVAWLGPGAGPASSQVSGNPETTFQVYAYTLQYKDPLEALPLIEPLLSQKGTVELQPGGKTLVVRDTLAALGRIVPALRAFDRPPQELRIEVMIVRADSRPHPSSTSDQLPEWLEERLRGLLRWDFYTLIARSGLETREDEGVTHEIGHRYGLSFRPGTLMAGDRLRLHDFKIWRVGQEDAEPLIEATLNLWLGKPKVLGLANSESSERALMVVLTCEKVQAPRGNAEGPPGGKS